MATIAETLDSVALACSVKSPASWVSATSDEHVEIRDTFLRQTVKDISDRVDLPAPVGKLTTITGDGSEEYSLPSDFRRMARSEWAVYETGLLYPLVPVSQAGEYEYIKDRGLAGAERYYLVEGYDGAHTIKIYRAPTASITISVSYVSSAWMATAGGTVGAAFTADDDVLLLPQDLVETGVIYRFRRRNGLVYNDVQADYEAKISRASSDAKGLRRVAFGTPQARRPWDVPVPDYIPES